jgi:hypothetical protein
MATITTIQGTDSLSASRQTLNDNFSAIATDLNDIDALLSINNSTLDVTSATIASATIGGSTIATTGNIFVANSQFDGKVTLNGGIVYDTETVLTLPSALGWNSTTYMVQAANATLSAATDGQEITLIADFAGTVTVDATMVAGASSIDLAQYGTLTLRYVGASWYIIGSFLATIA